jgi:hypothetical protein
MSINDGQTGSSQEEWQVEFCVSMCRAMHQARVATMLAEGPDEAMRARVLEILDKELDECMARCGPPD